MKLEFHKVEVQSSIDLYLVKSNLDTATSEDGDCCSISRFAKMFSKIYQL